MSRRPLSDPQSISFRIAQLRTDPGFGFGFGFGFGLATIALEDSEVGTTRRPIYELSVRPEPSTAHRLVFAADGDPTRIFSSYALFIGRET